MAWLSGYRYRKQIPITGQAGSGTDYQVKLEVYSGSGSDGAGVVYLSGHCDDFPDDIRFTDDDGLTELDYWLEEVDDDQATFWIEIADDLGSNQDFYIYYGHSTAGSASNGDNTFEFFDDFEGTSLDTSKWDLEQGAVALEESLIPAGVVGAFSRPVAEYYAGTYRRTYFVCLARSQKIQIRFYDHDTGYVSSPVTVHTYGSLDNHGTPSMLILSDGKIVVFYALHDSVLYCKKSTNAEDISAWGSAVTIEAVPACSYPQPVLLSNDDIWVFYRYAVASDHKTICYRVSTDDATSWGNRTTLVDFGSGYWLYPQTILGGSTIHVAWTRRSDPGGVLDNIYYIYSPDNGSAWKIRDGTSKTPPIDDTEADLVYDTGVGEKSIVVDIKLDASNNPYIAFIDDYGSDPADGRFAFYDSGWETHSVCNIDLTSYDNSGLCIDYRDVYTVYAGVPDSGKSEIQEWTSGDNGDTWAFSQSITDASNHDHVVPLSVKNYQADFKLLWNTLRHWTSQTNWDFYIMSNPSGMTQSLELTNTTGTIAILEGKTGFSPPKAYASSAHSSLPAWRNAAVCGARKENDLNERGGIWYGESGNANEAKFLSYRAGVSESTVNISIDDVVAWVKYEVIWGGTDDAKGYADGTLKVTHNTRVTGQDCRAFLWEGAETDTGVNLIDWFYVRKYNSPEPSVGTAQSEEEATRVPRPPAYSADIIIL